MISEARSTALASAVKIDQSSGKRCLLIWLPDITAQPTFLIFMFRVCHAFLWSPAGKELTSWLSYV